MNGRGCALLALLALGIFPRALAAQDVRIDRGPYLQALLDSSVIVLWRSNVTTTGKARLTLPAGDVIEIEEPIAAIDHRIELKGLVPGGTHRYRILDGDLPLTEDIEFRAAPPPGGSFRAVIVGDSGSGEQPQRDVAAVMTGLRPDLFLHTGDLLYDDLINLDIDLALFIPYRDLMARAGLYGVHGNHDRVEWWQDLFVPPSVNPERNGLYYSFDWASAHFIALDSEILLFPDQSAVHLEWMRNDLTEAKARGSTWLIMLLHRPLYSIGYYALEAPFFRPHLAPFIDEFSVDLVICGHDHNYQRSHPIRANQVAVDAAGPHFVSPAGTIYVVTGGGGGFLYAQEDTSDTKFISVFHQAFHAVELAATPWRLSLRAVAPGGSVLDEMSIRKEPFRFVRGDADFDGAIGISDPINVLGHLFLGQQIDCPGVADANARDGLGIDDPIYLLGYLFLAGPPPEPPFPGCGADAPIDLADCARFGCR